MMKKRLLAGLLCLMLLCTSRLPLARAEGDANDIADRVQSLIGDITAYHLAVTGAQNVQAWISESLAANAGVGAEWYVFALAQDGEYDFSAYRRNLLAYLESAGTISAATKQKYALALMAAGGNDPFLQTVASETIGAQGLMTWVYGLHLLNNGLEGNQTVQEALDKLLSLQLADGGWALTGAAADVDVTAMTVQALAPHAAQQAVGEAIDKALSLLSARQMENGDFVSYGVANPESTAQVMVALCALGINGLEDERFIKNGNTLLDGICRYQLADGSFSHTLGGAFNGNATVQALHAMVAYQRMQDGRGSLYLLERSAAEKPVQMEARTTLGYKPIVSGVIGAAALIACLVLFMTGKRNRKNFLLVLIIAAALIAFVLVTDFQTADGYYTGKAIVKENPIGKVTMSIRCDTVAGLTDAKHIPQDGVMLPDTSFDIVQGETVFDILSQAAQTYGIRLDSSGSPGMIYLSGINHLYEFAFGELSGWVYFVNGESSSVGCDQFVLSDGDRIEWRYTRSLGNDLKE